MLLKPNLIILALALSTMLVGQEDSDQKLIKATISQMFDGMRAGDSSMVRSAFIVEAPMTSVYNNKTGELKIRGGDLDHFVEAVGTPHEEIWNEEISNLKIEIDGPMASAWMDYKFYLGEGFSHCGVNHMILVRTDDGWKIQSITDTRRRLSCEEKVLELTEEELLHELDTQIWLPFIESYNNMDADAFNKLHSDDMLRITNNGISSGIDYKRKIIERFNSNKSKGIIKQLEIYFEDRQVSQNKAYEIGYYKLSITRPASKNLDYYYGRFHVLSDKINGQWYIIQDQDMPTVNGKKIDISWLSGMALFGE